MSGSYTAIGELICSFFHYWIPTRNTILSGPSVVWISIWIARWVSIISQDNVAFKESSALQVMSTFMQSRSISSIFSLPQWWNQSLSICSVGRSTRISHDALYSANKQQIIVTWPKPLKGNDTQPRSEYYIIHGRGWHGSYRRTVWGNL